MILALPQGIVFPVDQDASSNGARFGVGGECLPINECPTLMAILESNFQGIREFESCGFRESDDVPLYKCPAMNEDPLSHCLCRTAERCEPIKELVEQRNFTALKALERCGWSEDETPLYCCPKNLRRILSADDPNSSVRILTINSTQEDPTFKNICGFSDGTRIVGGSDVDNHAYPWAAALTYINPETNTRLYLCGGVLIKENFILTAAHCISTKNGHSLAQVRLGHAVLSDPNGVDVPIKAIHIHPDFEVDPILTADIALLELEENVPVNGNIRPICLLSSFNSTTILEGEVSGWGLIDRTNTSDRMQFLKVDIEDPEVCEQEYRAKLPWFRLEDSQICARGELGTDSCKGDSGGPLMYIDENSAYNLIGITSFGTTKCDSSVPGIYTKVTEFMDWIQDVAGLEDVES